MTIFCNSFENPMVKTFGSQNMKRWVIKGLHCEILLEDIYKCTYVSISIILADVLHVFYFFVQNVFLACDNFVWCCLLITFASTLDPDQDQMLVWYCFWKNFYYIKSAEGNKRMKNYPACKKLNFLSLKPQLYPFRFQIGTSTDWLPMWYKFHFLRSHRFAYQEYDLNLIHISDIQHIFLILTLCVCVCVLLYNIFCISYQAFNRLLPSEKLNILLSPDVLVEGSHSHYRVVRLRLTLSYCTVFSQLSVA